MPTNPVPLTVLEAYAENQVGDDKAMASELIDARVEIRMLWTALTEVLSMDQLCALSTAVITARKANS